MGDTIAVNGKVWPYLNVDRQRYRFFLIDGSNSRPYDMYLQDLTSHVKGPRMWVISTGGGYLDSPVLIDPNATGQQTIAGTQKSLFMMPGERYEIIVDFNDPVWVAAEEKAYKKKMPNPINLVLRNTAPTVDGNPQASLDGRIMQFRVSATAPVVDTSYDPASGTAIRTGGQQIVRLTDPTTGTLAAGVTADVTRLLTLNEVVGAGGPLEVLVNNTKWNGQRSDGTGQLPDSTYVLGNYLTELPQEGDTEVWQIVNTTVDLHPIHLHGLQFQLINRQPYDTSQNNGYLAVAYNTAFPDGLYIPGYGPPNDYNVANAAGAIGGNPDITPFLLGVPAPPLNYEAGWKDTVIVPPGQVTRIAVRIAPQDKAINAPDLYWPYQPNALDGAYVWHCHITDHEDNEMMRPSQFQPNPAAVRTYFQGVDY